MRARCKVLAVFGALLGCTNPPARAATDTAPAPTEEAATPAPAAPAPLPPPEPPPVVAATPALAGEPYVELPLPERGEPVVVSVPVGATEPQPLLVAAHGAGGKAITHCRLWRGIVGDRGFVVCPRGFPINRRDPDTGYFYDGHFELAAEISRALTAVTTAYPDHVDSRAPVYAGYSQGASMGAMMLPTHPARFARAALVEGGVGEHQEWNIAAAKRFAANGAERVLLICGRSICRDHARTTASYLERGGLASRFLDAPGAGHTYGGAVAEQMRAGFAWLVEGDARWGESATSAQVDDR